MLEMMKDWKGKLVVNGVEYSTVDDAIKANGNVCGELDIKLIGQKELEEVEKDCEYRIKVKPYMTQPATEDFDFMDKWNGGKPMPLRIMVGTVESETRGMVYMKLHADKLLGNQLDMCMKCGRPITNKVSKYFGMGPVCGGHNYTSPFESEEELDKAIKDYQTNVLSKITWEGWVIKSAIESKEEI